MRRTILLGIACALAIGGAAGPSSAGAAGGACRADLERLCADVKPGGGELARCLRQNADALSPECRQRIDARKAEAPERRAMREKLRGACAEDRARLCADAASGAPRGVLSCMRDHEQELSAACRSAVADARAARDAGR